MKLFAALAAFALLIAAAPALADAPVTLRDHIVASGPAITLGDVFDGAGAVGARAIAPAPPAGQASTLSPAVLVAAASAAGLDWTPPEGLNGVAVSRAAAPTSPRSSGLRATVPVANNQAQSPTAQLASARSAPDAVVHRGESVMIVYAVPGVQLSARARALEDGAVGQDIRLLNLASNRTIDATVTGPGAANAGPTQ